MKKSKHTPGPWRVEKDWALKNAVYWTVCAGPDRRKRIVPRYSFTPGMHGDITKEQVEANAYLIAAAPDLLEACELEEEAERLGQIWGNALKNGASIEELQRAKEAAFKASHTAVQKRREAIAKAKGEANV